MGPYYLDADNVFSFSISADCCACNFCAGYYEPHNCRPVDVCPRDVGSYYRGTDDRHANDFFTSDALSHNRRTNNYIPYHPFTDHSCAHNMDAHHDCANDDCSDDAHANVVGANAVPDDRGADSHSHNTCSVIRRAHVCGTDHGCSNDKVAYH